MRRLTAAGNLLGVVLGIAFLGTTVPFEVVYRLALCSVQVPELPKSEVSSAVGETLWLAVGEPRGAAVQPFWAWAWLVHPSDARGGRSAIHEVTRLWLKRRPPRASFLSELALDVWLSRHATAVQLQRALAEWEDFGRNAVGISAAASAYFDVGPADLQPHQLALLASIVSYHSGLDPFCDAEAALSRRALFLGQMVGVGLLPKGQALQTLAAPLGVAPTECVCKRPGRSSRVEPRAIQALSG